jgi:hypothetical protein
MGVSVEEGSEKCMHRPCHCIVQPGQQYCSPYCEAEANAGGTSQACDCGHTWCEQART